MEAFLARPQCIDFFTQVEGLGLTDGQSTHSFTWENDISNGL